MNLPFFIAGWSFVDGVRELPEPSPGPLAVGCWYHFQRDAQDTELRLRLAGIPLSAICSVLAEDTRPRFELLDDGNFLLNLRGVNLNEGETPDDMLSIRILFYNGVLISTRKFPSRAISDIRSELAEGLGPRDLAEVLVAIIDKLHQRIEDFVEPAETLIAEQEDEHSTEESELMPLNKRLIKLRRFLKPQRFALEDMLETLPALLLDKRLALANARDTAARINESIDFYLEHIALVGQYQARWHSEKVNRNTYLLSILSGVFLPISFLTGLFGINIAGMPGIDNPLAFAVFSISLVGLVAIEVILLKRWRFI
ncbi:CorA family divalent cation transporter [Halomonas cupida]|uniref:CorA family divalent cation transporter n=1 Tax=Halomonas cupida TaxID=44933 RepID=UPI003A92C138